jgi:hypothetical protein
MKIFSFFLFIFVVIATFWFILETYALGIEMATAGNKKLNVILA